MTTTTPEQPRRAKRVSFFETTGRPVVNTPRRAVIETVPEPRSEGDPRHLAMTAHSTRRADR